MVTSFGAGNMELWVHTVITGGRGWWICYGSQVMSIGKFCKTSRSWWPSFVTGWDAYSDGLMGFLCMS